MIPAPHSARSIETTADGLREELRRLEVQKQALERELAAVVAHLGSVQQALGALRILMADPREVPARDTTVAGGTDPGEARVADVPRTDTATGRPGTRPAPPAAMVPQPKTGRRPKEPASTPTSVGTDGTSTYGRITDQILEYFATIGGADVRARDVAAALGRDTGNGSINAVRSTLDRLVGTSRLERAGRGLYRSKDA